MIHAVAAAICLPLIMRSSLRRKNNTRRTNKVNNKDFTFKKETIKIIPLGGLGEIGKNITAIEYEDEIIKNLYYHCFLILFLYFKLITFYIIYIFT